MAHVVVFSDEKSFSYALEVSRTSGIHVQPLEIPSFCSGIVPPGAVVNAGLNQLLSEFASRGVGISGVIPYRPPRREIPQAPPPDSRWREILGTMRTMNVRRSLSDPQRLRVEVSPENSLEELIPIMARLIRGGAYQPEARILAFEEDHRLVAFSARTVVISRADDLLDVWIILRCAIDLIGAAWDNRNTLEPDRAPRYGIGAVEIFRRLPGSNCGSCEQGGCMEFATQVFTGRRRIEECLPLLDPEYASYLDSVRWLGSVIGFLPGGTESPEKSR